MFGSLGIPEMLIVGLLVALIFGPSRLPKMGKALGETIREFRQVGKQLEEAEDDIRDGH